MYQNASSMLRTLVHSPPYITVTPLIDPAHLDSPPLTPSQFLLLSWLFHVSYVSFRCCALPHHPILPLNFLPLLPSPFILFSSFRFDKTLRNPYKSPCTCVGISSLESFQDYRMYVQLSPFLPLIHGLFVVLFPHLLHLSSKQRQ